MQLGMIGLGRMGAGMVRRLMRAGHECVVHDLGARRVTRLAAEGANALTEQVLDALAQHLEAGDIVADGGNSHYEDSVRRAHRLAEADLHFVDAGVSGGVFGLEHGYCLMLGGAHEALARLGPIPESLAPGGSGAEATAERGCLHCGPPGAGHFVKMVHNGVEYGVMQAYAEGFDLLRHAGSGAAGAGYPELPIAEIAEVWRHGSVIRSWLLDLVAAALRQDAELGDYEGFVQDSGAGRWTVHAAVERAVPADVITAALYRRFRSRQTHTFADRVLSALRHRFGGHEEGPAP